MQTIIYFVRHGTVYNPANILYGRLPRFGLAEEGVKEIEQTAKFLATQQIDSIYSSPLLRTKQTAEIIQKKLGLPKIYFSNYLLEINSSLQGCSFAYARSLHFDVFAGPNKKDITGETIDEVSQRIQTFIATIIKNYPGKKIVAVSHGDPIMLVKAHIERLPIVNESLRPGEDKYLQQGEVYKVTCDEYLPLTIESIFKPKL